MRALQTWMGAAGLAAVAAGCIPSGGADMAARLDPTGLSASVVGTARDLRPNSEVPDDSGSIDLSLIAPRLDAVAAGDLSRPDMAGAIDGRISQAMTMQTLNLAASVANAGVGAAMTGGASLAAPSLLMQAAGTGYAVSKMSEARGQVRGTMARAEAERAAARIVPDADRPAEAQAILSVIDGAGRSAAWQNPTSGASGKVTIKALNRSQMPGDIRCRLVVREWRGTGGSRRGNMMVCASCGVWYDLS